MQTTKQTRVDAELQAEECDFPKLRNLAWHGLSPPQRALAWKVLLGYLPVTHASRASTLARKRAEYREYCVNIYELRDQHQTEKHQKDQKQIHDDMPRTQPDVPFFRTPEAPARWPANELNTESTA